MSNESEVKKEPPPKQKTVKLSSEMALPQSGVDTLIKIIKGYAVASQGGESQTNYKDVASVATLNPGVVSGSNRFLTEAGIITSPKYGYYLPSEEAIRYAREAAWDEEKAKSYLRKLVSKCWFGQVAIQTFALRPALSRDDLKRSLAIKSGATEGDSVALDRLIEFILYTGLIVETEQGMLAKGNLDEVESFATIATKTERHDESSGVSLNSPFNPERAAVSVILHVHVQNLNDLSDEHAEAIRKWIRKLSTDQVQIDADTQ